jgi:hypothetical protein
VMHPSFKLLEFNRDSWPLSSLSVFSGMFH